MSLEHQEKAQSQETGDRFRTWLQQPSVCMTCVKKSPNSLHNLCPPSTVSHKRGYVLQAPPDFLVLLVHKDHVAGGDLGERKVTQVALDHLENQEWLDFQDLGEKRVIRANQEIRDHLGGLENQYLLHKWWYHLQITLEMKEEIRWFIVRLEETLLLLSNGDSRAESFCREQSIWLKKQSWSSGIWITAMLGSTNVRQETFLDRLRRLVIWKFEVRSTISFTTLKIKKPFYKAAYEPSESYQRQGWAMLPGWLFILLNVFCNWVLLHCYWGSMMSRRATTTIKRVMVCVKRVRDNRKQRLELNSCRRSIRT